jgi:hypothetical protein
MRLSIYYRIVCKGSLHDSAILIIIYFQQHFGGGLAPSGQTSYILIEKPLAGQGGCKNNILGNFFCRIYYENLLTLHQCYLGILAKLCLEWYFGPFEYLPSAIFCSVKFK